MKNINGLSELLLHVKLNVFEGWLGGGGWNAPKFCLKLKYIDVL